MFKPTRWHRILTVPAIVAALAAVVASGHPIYVVLVVAVCPWIVPAPWLLAAAIDRTDRSVARALTGVRVASYGALAWGLFGVFYEAPAGLLMMGVGAIMLLAAGAKVSEARVAVITSLLGVVLMIEALPLGWIAVPYVVLLPAGFVMFLSGAIWLGEAQCAPLPDSALHADLPRAVAL